MPDDTFRASYASLTATQTRAMEVLKATAATMDGLLDGIGPSLSGNPESARHRSIARTKLEECVMWATKGITA